MAPSEQRELENLSTRLTRLEADTKEQNAILAELRDLMVGARSSWKLMMGVAGFAAMLGGIVAKFLPFWLSKP